MLQGRGHHRPPPNTAPQRSFRIALPTRQQVGYAVRFALCMGLLIAAFSHWEPAFASLYLRPASSTAAAALNLLGIDTALDTSCLPLGYCGLETVDRRYHVEYECTGIFYLFVFLGAVAAYPTSHRHRAWGVLGGIPAFFALSTTRIIALVAIGHVVPSWLEFAHIYLMVLLNLGFLVFALAIWANRRP